MGAAFTLLAAVTLAEAQPPRNIPERDGWLLVPSLQSSAVYEDNVLFTPDPGEGSWLLRLTPRLDAFYRRESRYFEAGYSFDTERYPERFETLNDVFARQEAHAELRTLLNRRTSVVLGSTFLDTSRPEEVLQDTGLISARRRSRSLVATAQLTRALDRRLSWTAGYAFSLRDFERPEGLVPRLGGTMHSFATGLSHRHSPRATSSLTYALRVFIQEERAQAITPINQFASHVGTYRFSRTLSRKVDLALALGPRFSEALQFAEGGGGQLEKTRDVAPEAFASLVYRGDGKQFLVQYTRSQSQAFGLSGFVDTQNGVFTAELDFGPRLRVEGVSGVYQNTRVGITTNSYQSEVSADYRIASWASFEASYLFQYQDRLLASIDGVVQATDESITRNTVLLGLRLFTTYDAP